MSSHAKPRSDSKLLTMPHHQQDALAEWLLEGTSYADALERLHLDFNVRSSAAALSVFWQRVCTPRRLKLAAEAANALPGVLEGAKVNWQQASVQLVQQLYFELLAAPTRDPQELAIFAAQVAAIGRGELEREKLRTSRQRAALSARLKRRDQRLDREKFEDQRVRAAAELEKLRKPAGEPLPEAERTAILDKVDEILGIRKGGAS